jgi:hypothetical protein
MLDVSQTAVYAPVLVDLFGWGRSLTVRRGGAIPSDDSRLVCEAWLNILSLRL